MYIMYRGLWCVALALATSATAGLLPPLPEPEPTSDFNPDFPLRLLPPMPYVFCLYFDV